MFDLSRFPQGTAGIGPAILTVGIVVIALIIASYPVIKMIGWWADGGAEPILAVVSIFLYLALIGAMMVAPAGVAIAIFIAIVASAIMVPHFGQMSENAQNARILEERLQQYAAALERNPRDAAARIALAEALYKKGERDQAIEHLAWTLQQFPALSLRIRPQLESWRREKERQGMPQPIFCHMCRAENPFHATHCIECGAAFGLRRGVEQRVWQEGGPRVVIRGWIVTATVLILSCFLLLTLPIEFAAPMILAICLVGAWLFLRWVGGDMGTVGD